MNQIIFTSSLIIAALLVFSLLKKEKTEGLKLFLFWGMVIPIIFTTAYLAAGTVIKNQQSVTGGPVHWHADYEIYVCGKSIKDENLPQSDDHTSSFEFLQHLPEWLNTAFLLGAIPLEEGAGFIPQARAHEGEAEELDLVDPTGFSNRVGTSDFHEHGDGRIHVEGVVEHLEDVSLGKFFEAIGGQLTQTFMRLPTNHGEVIVQNGMPCPDGKPGAWQGFVYKTKGDIVTQKKLENFVDYVLSPYSTIPPGDCIIMKFDSEIKNRTEKICQFYQIALEKGEVKLTPSLSPP